MLKHLLKPQDDAPLNSFRPFPGWIRWTPSAWTSSGYPEVGLHSQLSAKVAKMPLDNVAWFR